MADAQDSNKQSGRCAYCGGSTDLRTRHVVIEGNVVRAYCSAECAASATNPVPMMVPPLPLAGPRPTSWWRYAARLSLTVPMLVFTSGHDRALAPKATRLMVASAPASMVAPPPPDPTAFGPHWPPTDDDWMAEIGRDAWIHPLDGPTRRMPITDSRVFGAERPGDRPGECRNGHCGVDLSGYWGEPVHAVHDGVVERVQRGPNEEHGGLYVRIAHREGTIFSQYFHLAAIPRWVQPGAQIKVGDLIGLVGDSGVKHSKPHLHFTLSVRPGPSSPDKYMDPEPLIALWPLRIALDPAGGPTSVAAVTTHLAPGVPHGAASKHAKKTRQASAVPLPGAAPAGDESDGGE